MGNQFRKFLLGEEKEEKVDKDNKEVSDEDLNLKRKIFKFFLDNPNPEDSKVHGFADELNIEPDKLEGQIYSLLSMFINGFGNHNQIKDEKFDKKELELGIEIEMEHINTKFIPSHFATLFAKRITKDHLTEIKNYNSKLKEMEKNNKKEDEVY